jgi:hypothetical protein
MYAVIMWAGLAVFIAALCLSSVVNTRKKNIQKAGRQPDPRDRQMDRVARVLFFVGMALWIFGALIMAGKGS